MDKDYIQSLYMLNLVKGGGEFRCPTMTKIEEDFILRQEKIFHVMMDQVNEETTLNLTNMHVLYYNNVRVVYDILHGP